MFNKMIIAITAFMFVFGVSCSGDGAKQDSAGKNS
jgi:hypothetical protein